MERMFCKAKSYKGKGSYAFISYCHRDGKKVYPILERLAREGYHIWYDAGIEVGKDWTEVIADNLKQASVCIAFFSHESLKSLHCKREVKYAILQNIPFIAVFLESVEVSAGLEMQLAMVQSIDYTEYETESTVVSKLIGSKLIEKCKGQPDESVVVQDWSQWKPETGMVFHSTLNRSHLKNSMVVFWEKVHSAGMNAIGILFFPFVISLIMIVLWYYRNTNDSINNYSFSLIPDANVTVKDFQEAGELINGRIKAYVGDYYYDLEQHDGEINVDVSKEAFEEDDWYEVFYRLILGEDRLSFVNKIDDKHLDKIEIDLDDIDVLEAREGKLDNVDYEELKANDSVYAILKLSDDFISRYRDFLEALDNVSFIYWDMAIIKNEENGDLVSGSYLNLIKTDNTGEFYVVSDESTRFWDGLIYAFNNEPLDVRIRCYEDLNSLPEWESTKDADNKGEYQVDSSDIEEDTITISLNIVNSFDELSSGELADLDYTVKKRLDVLKQPYAVSIPKESNDDRVYIKTKFDGIGFPIISLIGATSDSSGMPSNISICTERGNSFSFSNDVSVEKIGDDLCIVVKEKETSTWIHDFTKNMLDDGEEYLYLMIGRKPLCSTHIKKTLSDHMIIFDHLDLENDLSQIPEELPYSLLECVQQTHLPYSFSLCAYQDNTVSNTSKVSECEAEKKFGYRDGFCVEMIKKIVEKYPDVNVYNSDEGLQIILNQKIDESFVSNCVSMMKDIYEICDMEHNSIEDICFYLADTMEGANCGLFSFHKKYDYEEDESKISLYVSLNSSLDSYKKSFKKVILSDSFYCDKKPQNNASWPWD